MTEAVIGNESNLTERDIDMCQGEEGVLRKLRLSLFVCLLCLFVAVPVWADPSLATNGGGYNGGTVSYTTSPYGGINGGGEFSVGGSGLLLPVSHYDARTSNQGGQVPSFQTFCVEKDEYIGTMNIWVSTEFVNGDPGSHAYGGGKNTDTGDNLDFKTAWLYEQFATGQLLNYDFDDDNYGSGGSGVRKNDAAALQWAIWYIEQEVDTKPGKAGTYYQMAEDAAPNSIGNVRVLQAYVGDQFKQDQLYYVPVPGAVLLGLLGLGAAGIKLRQYA